MKSLKFASSAVLAAAALTIGLCATPAAFAADELSLGRPAGERARAVDAASNRPPATFFTIADVLAKLDRQRGRGPNAIRTASLTPPNTATDAVPAAKPLPPVGAEPFGLFTFRAPENGLWRKWRGLESDLAKEQSVLEQCRDSAAGCPSQAAQFLRLIGAVKSRSGRDRLDEANRAVNQAIRYVSDFAQHGEADRWTAPLATFATGKGDCEDYAIAKYIALSEAGFPREDLRLVLGRDRTIRQDHAVLAARLDGHWLILDSRRSELIDDGELGNFTPMFAINDRGVQLFAAPYAKRLPLGDELDAAPAAANAVETEWTGAEALDAASPLLGFLPVLM
ncbi:putative transglutaminase-like cysteine proteinase [Bradyrhizobium japonicum]|uniref:transglutaminase-like cysteine peptidase n=1 Tax=Bradyrhizobium TaxID=374 RepID=UPI0003726873|nr:MULTISPECIES: transglutaminase-like cysteine peptidase [Bradyrhizobium]MCP1730115.1 putative transglutaminase-like cysteine proteinase [Bradyrhizobium elkanii]MCP1930570.1 putative transglutaminase-like cysteine proteinase [Bradyrhizobium elkanii]MCS3518016.1 putative transglutaminase-like cysteine proteinase [Bradyrhizobium elkanii]MCS3574244.1 putative transglutaminase-like cysteine proteinase [Bradyrhizobium elkanii]MCS3578812.1 putative transglutaminase-like cysteine proteinase [Bradyrh